MKIEKMEKRKQNENRNKQILFSIDKHQYF